MDRIGIAGVARVDWLAAGEAFVLAVVEADAILAEFPAEVDFVAINARGEIEQAHIQIFHHAAGFLDAIQRGLNALLQAIELLASGSRVFARRCIAGREADAAKCEGNIENSLAMCTALAPVIGYDKAAKIASCAASTAIAEAASRRSCLANMGRPPNGRSLSRLSRIPP